MAILLEDVGSGYNLVKINTNFQLIEDSLNNDVLKREIDVGEDNAMRTHLDMNQNKIVNVGWALEPDDAVPLEQLEFILSQVE